MLNRPATLGRPEPGLIVTDVENTLFDWLGTWARATDALLTQLQTDSGCERTELVDAFRQVALRRNAVECQSALEDLVTLELVPMRGDRFAMLARAAAVYRRYWDIHLAPYTGLCETLSRLASDGWQIVAYTENDAAIAAARLARMGLAGAVRTVFGRVPAGSVTRKEWSLFDLPQRALIAVDIIPREDSKPNPAGLHNILTRCGVPASRTLYLGNDIDNDITMANRLGVRSLWASYGNQRTSDAADLLAAIAPWAAIGRTHATATQCQPGAEGVISAVYELFDAITFVPAVA